MKKKIVKIVVIVLILIIGLGQIPIPHSVFIKETAIEYSLSQEDVAIPHEIFIDGTYYTRLIGKDRFVGAFYVSDVARMEEGTWAEFDFEPWKRHHPGFRLPSGEPVTTGIGMIFFERNFETLAFQLAYEFIEHEDGYSMSHSDGESNFIVVGAIDRDDALAIYQKLLAERKGMTI